MSSIHRIFYLVLACGLMLAPHTQASILYLSTAFNVTDYTPGTNPCCNSITQISDNGTFATGGKTDVGANSTETVSSTADLANGALHVLNQGTITGSPIFVNVSSQAVIGDTFTASGPIGGFNLGVNLSIHGSSESDAPNDYTLLVVEALPVGSFDQNNIYQTPLFSGYYVVGNSSFPGGSSGFGPTLASILYNTTNDLGTIADGAHQVTVPIPFSTLGQNFQLVFALNSYEINQLGATTPTGDGWNTDYSNTVGVSLTVPNSVSLTSDSGVFPITTASATPEPSSLGLLAAGLLACVLCTRRSAGTPSH